MTHCQKKIDILNLFSFLYEIEKEDNFHTNRLGNELIAEHLLGQI